MLNHFFSISAKPSTLKQIVSNEKYIKTTEQRKKVFTLLTINPKIYMFQSPNWQNCEKSYVEECIFDIVVLYFAW